MKAIGTAAISHPGAIMSGAIWAAGLFSGVIWLVMGLTGAVTWIAKITSRPVVHGTILGLGLSFMLEGVKMMDANPILAVGVGAFTFLLLSSERIPVMLVFLSIGVIAAIAYEPALLEELGRGSFRLRLPEFALMKLGWNDLATGIIALGLPQLGVGPENS